MVDAAQRDDQVEGERLDIQRRQQRQPGYIHAILEHYSLGNRAYCGWRHRGADEIDIVALQATRIGFGHQLEVVATIGQKKYQVLRLHEPFSAEIKDLQLLFICAGAVLDSSPGWQG